MARRVQKVPLGACCLVLMLACHGAAASGARRLLQHPTSADAAAAVAPGSSGQQQGRHLRQFLNGVTAFFDTPAAAGSVSGNANARGYVEVDGTFNVAGGVGGAQSLALSNPLLPVLSDGGLDNRPEASTASYTQIPLFQGPLFSLEPTVGYGTATGTGGLGSTANGGFGVAGFAYNPIANNLGFSAAVGANDALNPLGGDFGPGLFNAEGSPAEATVEMIGASRPQVDAATARVAQNAQGTAGPDTVAPGAPLTCTQALTYGITLANYDVGGPAGPLPRNSPADLVPYCLQLFNFGVLDDFEAFIDGFNGLGGDYEDGEFGDPNAGIGADAVLGSPESSAAAAGTGAPRTFGGSGATRAAAAPSTQQRAQQEGPPTQTRSQQLAADLAAQGNPAILAFLQTPVGEALLQRVDNGYAAQFADGLASIATKAAENLGGVIGRPLERLRSAANNATQAVAANVTNALLEGAVGALEAIEPVVFARVAVNQQVVEPLARLGAALGAASEELVSEELERLPADVARAVRAFNSQVDTPPGLAADAGSK